MPIDPATQAGVHSDRETTDMERQEGGVNLIARSPAGRVRKVDQPFGPDWVHRKVEESERGKR